MKIVDNYEINDGQVFSVELAEDRYVDVKAYASDARKCTMQKG